MGYKAKITLGVVALAAASAVLWYSFRVPVTVETAQTPNGSPPPFISPVVDGMRIYRSYLLGFEVRYPEDFSVKEYGKGNTSTITFEDQKGDKGFQVFVVPYSDATVSAERFAMDVPSGVMLDAQEVTVDGARGSAFFSQNLIMGETREVWFIHDGFLYEISTYKDLDLWLASIMKTWEFI